MFGACNCGRLLGRDRYKTMQDAYCGVCILTLYFLYLMVVKGALSVFDCSPVRRCRCVRRDPARCDNASSASFAGQHIEQRETTMLVQTASRD